VTADGLRQPFGDSPRKPPLQLRLFRILILVINFTIVHTDRHDRNQIASIKPKRDLKL
jgi:hypothetical protein